jgi:radical SAM-linked protein
LLAPARAPALQADRAGDFRADQEGAARGGIAAAHAEAERPYARDAVRGQVPRRAVLLPRVEHGQPELQQVEAAAPPAAAAGADDQCFRYRLLYAKQGPARFISHLEFSSSFARALRRAGLPVRYSQGFHPLPRVTFHEALPVGMECLGARCDLELTAQVAPDEILQRLTPQLPQGVELLAVQENPLKTAAAADTLKAYKIIFPLAAQPRLPDESERAHSIARFAGLATLPIRIEKKGGMLDFDLKEIIAGLELEPDGSVMLRIAASGGSLPKITDIAAALFGLDERSRKLLRILSVTP